MKTNRATRQDYKSVIYSGCAIECKGVSLCNLEDVMRNRIGVPRAKYQVWSDRHRYHNLFHNIDEAIEKFVDLINKKR